MTFALFLKSYIQKVTAKYKLTEDELIKVIETDPDLLRKRQKNIYYGKVTDEYKRYLKEIPKYKIYSIKTTI